MHGTVKYFWGCIILQCGRTHPPTLPCNTNYFCKNIRTPPFQLKDSENFLLHFLKIIFHVTMKWNDRSANTSNKKLKIFPCQFTKRQNNISQKLTWALSHKVRYFCFLFLTDMMIKHDEVSIIFKWMISSWNIKSLQHQVSITAIWYNSPDLLPVPHASLNLPQKI